MTTNLGSMSLASVYRDKTDTQRMELIIDITKDVNWHTFVHHPLIKSKFIERLCGYVDALDNAGKLKPGQANSVKYMLLNSDLPLDTVLWLCDKNVIVDMLRYVNPMNWKWYQILHHSDGNDYIIVFKHQQNVEGEKEFNFQRDVVSGNLDPTKIKRIWRSNNTLVDWTAFSQVEQQNE